MKKPFAFLLSATAFVLHSHAIAQAQPPNQVSKSERMFQSQGAKTCLPEIRRVSNFLTESNDHSVLVTSSKEAPDSGILMAKIVRNFSDGDIVSVLNTAPSSQGKCTSSYTVITPFDKSCTVVRETIVKELTFKETLGNLPRLINKDGTTDTLLLPVSSNACVAIRTQAVY